MDIISHALLGAAIVNDKSLILPAMLFGAAPDFMNGIVARAVMIPRLRNKNKNWREIVKVLFSARPWKEASPWMHEIYFYLHGLPVAFLLTLFVYYIYPPWLILMKAWFLHLGIDYLTHYGWYAVKPFYPLSEWRAGLFNWFKSPLEFGGIFISLLIFLWVYFVV